MVSLSTSVALFDPFQWLTVLVARADKRACRFLFHGTIKKYRDSFTLAKQCWFVQWTNSRPLGRKKLTSNSVTRPLISKVKPDCSRRTVQRRSRNPEVSRILSLSLCRLGCHGTARLKRLLCRLILCLSQPYLEFFWNILWLNPTSEADEFQFITLSRFDAPLVLLIRLLSSVHHQVSQQVILGWVIVFEATRILPFSESIKSLDMCSIWTCLNSSHQEKRLYSPWNSLLLSPPFLQWPAPLSLLLSSNPLHPCRLFPIAANGLDTTPTTTILKWSRPVLTLALIRWVSPKPRLVSFGCAKPKSSTADWPCEYMMRCCENEQS